MSGVFALTLALSSPAIAQQDCTQSSLIKRPDSTYAIVLENSCSTQVKWSYAACAFGNALDSGLVSVEPGQSFQSEFRSFGLSPPLLKENSCEGACLVPLPTCPAGADAPLKPLNELLKTEPTEPALESPDELFGPSPTTSDDSIYRELSTFDPEPATGPEQKTVSEALKIKPSQLPANVGVKPAAPAAPKDYSKVSDLLAPKPPAYSVGRCVYTELGKRNLFGMSSLKFVNMCQKDVEVGARVCVDGKTDKQTIISIPKNASKSELISHPKDSPPLIRYDFCESKGCAPIRPQSCGG